jgi:hypothetical protein
MEIQRLLNAIVRSEFDSAVRFGLALWMDGWMDGLFPGVLWATSSDVNMGNEGLKIT